LHARPVVIEPCLSRLDARERMASHNRLSMKHLTRETYSRKQGIDACNLCRFRDRQHPFSESLEGLSKYFHETKLPNGFGQKLLQTIEKH
jgi:hypothetical protein